MYYVCFELDQKQYIQFDQSCPENAVDIFCRSFALTKTEGSVQQAALTVSFDFKGPKQVEITRDGNRFFMKLNILFKLMTKLIFNCFVASLVLRKKYLLVHGLLLSTGEVIYGQAYSGKTTLARKLDNVLCDDDVLIDLQNKVAYPVPYFYYDPMGKFNGKPIKPIPVPLSSLKPINQKQDLFRCSIVFLYQPFAQREEVYFCPKNKKWCNFQKSFEQIMKSRIKQLISNK